MHGIRLVTIDLDDTLWPCAPVIQRAEQRLFEWLSAVAPRLTAAHDLASLREHRKAVAAEQPHRAHDLTWLRREHLRRLLGSFDYDEAIADQGVEIFRRARNQVTPFPDVVPALTILRASFTVISVTNGNAEVQATPLRGLFHHNLTAAGVGAAKPHPALFEAALEKAGVSVSQALHVGDDPLRDVEAARHLGMRSVWIYRHARTWPEELAPPDAAFSTLGELASSGLLDSPVRHPH
jgi:putative hydrolase of the HAD superfamily